MDFIYMLIGLGITFTVLFLAVGLMVFDRVLDYRRMRNCEQCQHCECRGGN